MKHLAEWATAMAMAWAAMFALACALTAAVTGSAPTAFLLALYVATTGPVALSWAAGVAAPVGARRG